MISLKWISKLLSTLFILILCNMAFAAKTPNFECVLTDSMIKDGAPAIAKDTFNKDTPMIYLFCQSNEVRKGQNIKSVWIADNTNNVAPNDYHIAEKTVVVDKDAPKDQYFTTRFSLSKPTKGWPVGTYHVEMYVGKDLIKSVKFSVK